MLNNTYITFIDSSVNGPLGASIFLLLRIMLLITCKCRFLFKIFLYFKVELVDHIIILSLTFLRIDQLVFHSGFTILHFYQQWTRILISLHPCQYCQPIFFLSLFHFSFLTIDVLRGMRQHFTVVWKAVSWFQKYLDICITTCKIRQPVEIYCMIQRTQIWCDNLEGWDDVGRRLKGEGTYIYTYGWSMLIHGRSQNDIIKQLSFN